MAAMCANGRRLTLNRSPFRPAVFYCETEVVYSSHYVLHHASSFILQRSTHRRQHRISRGQSSMALPVSCLFAVPRTPLGDRTFTPPLPHTAHSRTHTLAHDTHTESTSTSLQGQGQCAHGLSHSLSLVHSHPRSCQRDNIPKLPKRSLPKIRSHTKDRSPPQRSVLVRLRSVPSRQHARLLRDCLLVFLDLCAVRLNLGEPLLDDL